MSPRTRTAIAAVGSLALALVALAVFVLPFAFPTPPPIITRFHATQFFSPNDDGRRDVARISVRVRVRSDIQIEVRQGSDLVKTLVDRDRVPPGWLRVSWGGQDEGGVTVPDGTYSLRLRARAGEKQFNTSRRIVVDSTPPPFRRFDVTSAAIAGPGAGECRTRIVPDEAAAARIAVLPQGGRTPVRTVGPRPLRAGQLLNWSWNGRVEGEPAPVGLYRVQATLTDTPGNRTTRTATCWVGHLIGEPVVRGAAGRRLGVALTTVDGTAVPAGTPVRLTLRRRLGTPGEGAGPVVGRTVSGPVAGRAAGATIALPRGADPAILWLVATTADGEALVPLDGVAP